MKKILLLFGVCLLHATIYAAEPEALNIVRTDATISSTLLDDVQRITFNEEETMMTITKTDEVTKDFALLDIQYLMFGAYSAENDTPTGIADCVVRNAESDTRKVLENGNLIIIKNGIRYSVLGIRL